MAFVRIPYLPMNAKLAVGDISLPDVKVIAPYAECNLPEGIKRHADLTLCYLGEGVAVCPEEAYDYYAENLLDEGIILIKGERVIEHSYPYDASYNVAIVGNRMFCRKDITDPVLLKTAEEMGYKIINIKQGYAKCSVCPVDENSAISADMSFFKAAKKEGLDVLLVTNDTIGLKGYSNGFFGGCAFMKNSKTLFTKGDIKAHPDYERIKEFLDLRNIKIECTNEKLFDFGSFIPIIEE